MVAGAVLRGRNRGGGSGVVNPLCCVFGRAEWRCHLGRGRRESLRSWASYPRCRVNAGDDTWLAMYGGAVASSFGRYSPHSNKAASERS